MLRAAQPPPNDALDVDTKVPGAVCPTMEEEERRSGRREGGRDDASRERIAARISPRRVTLKLMAVIKGSVYNRRAREVDGGAGRGREGR